MKRVLVWILLLTSVCAAAQYNVSGRVQTHSDGMPVEMATIRLFSYADSDSTLVQGAQTDDQGRFLLTHIPAGTYKLYVSNVGFREQQQAVTLRDSDVELRPIRLHEEVQALAEVQVQGHAAEMTVKGDTIEYNTAAYKVSENAMVEDLLKKMNGVTVDKEGNVTVNGESITSVRIDGKKFFGKDVQSATKNIPADMIEKVQVIDEKSDMAKLTGFDDDEGEHIINLTLKKNKQRGVFGKYAGALGADMVTANGRWFNYADPAYGATPAARAKHFFEDDFRYNANIFTNILLGNSQTTIIGGANNTNEVLMGRGRRAFSGTSNSGITWSESLGVNTNIDFTNRINHRDSKTNLVLGGDAAVNHSYNTTQTEQNKTEYAGLSKYQSAQISDILRKAWDVNLRFELEYQIDSMNKLVIQPTLSYTESNSASRQDFNYWEDSVVINSGEQNKIDSTREMSAGAKVTYNHKFFKPGRALTLSANYDFADTRGYNRTLATGTNRVDQFTRSGNDSHSYSLRVSYVEPLYGKNHLLEIAVNASGRNRKSYKDQFSKDTLTNAYAFDSTYSNELGNHYYTEQLELNYRWVSKKTDLTVGVRGLATQTHSLTTYGGILLRDTTVYSLNFAPRLKFKYKFGKKEFARINYQGKASQPSITQMQPVRNNSNAMQETIGNLALKPAFAHNLQFMYSKFNQDRFSSLMTGLRGTLTQNALVNNTYYDETGKQYQQTVNADMLPWNVSADLMYNTPFYNKLFQFNTRTTLSYNQRVAYIRRGFSASEIAAMIAANTITLGERSLTGNLQASEEASLRFTHSIADVGVRANFLYSYTHNTLKSTNNSHVFNWGVTGDVVFHLPQSWNIGADCGYTARYGYDLDDVNEVILNAYVEKTWKITTLSLKVFDILHQKKNIVQTISENAVTYAKYNTLPTYFMLTCSIRLNKMGDLKAKGRAAKMQEMMESGSDRGGMPPMGPPMGPPPDRQ